MNRILKRKKKDHADYNEDYYKFRFGKNLYRVFTKIVLVFYPVNPVNPVKKERIRFTDG